MRISDRPAASRRTGAGRLIKHLYELYLLRTLKLLACGHNLARTYHWNCCSMVLSLAKS